MIREMPCRTEKVMHYGNPASSAPVRTKHLGERTWLGFAKVDLETPKALW